KAHGHDTFQKGLKNGDYQMGFFAYPRAMIGKPHITNVFVAQYERKTFVENYERNVFMVQYESNAFVAQYGRKAFLVNHEGIASVTNLAMMPFVAII
ncbi:hypothetical protein J1N35_001150, partial [Gossypium stocksii]